MKHEGISRLCHANGSNWGFTPHDLCFAVWIGLLDRWLQDFHVWGGKVMRISDDFCRFYIQEHGASMLNLPMWTSWPTLNPLDSWLRIGDFFEQWQERHLKLYHSDGMQSVLDSHFWQQWDFFAKNIWTMGQSADPIVSGRLWHKITWP